MFKRLNWRIVALIAFVIAAGGFIYWNVSTVQQMKKQTALFEKLLEEEKKPAVAKKPPPAAPGKKWVPHGAHWHEVPIDAPDVWQGEPHTNTSQTGEQFSTNPLLLTEIPEHLRMPPEWDNFHYMEAYDDGGSGGKFKQQARAIAEEVVANYNPKRPIKDVWPAFIAAEKRYNAESPYSHLNPGVPGIGGYRGDWFYKQIWDFPEVFELMLYEEPEIDESAGTWLDVYEIEMGLLNPDWNRFILPDNRVFRTKHGYKYQFNMGYDKERGKYNSSVSFCRSDPSTAKLIVIDLDTTSDETLEQLSGRNYNTNPYTGKPIAYPGPIHYGISD